ncbi:hypothetical protein E3226_001925 [Legionella geestiana]|uniref:hypothetical protein n=1 Tax=Legionella geestiana TaxID=45065 RepID=UPI00117F696F|nr:hypothetical protein [Legionella geestiana]QDQ39251.1 hypothetical protein E3226_001925 [Legionella geestiana]
MSEITIKSRQNNPANVPEIIFLLTAPFDENAKTGDGQYALSLAAGFLEFGEGTDCIWIREADKHYSLPCYKGCTPVPAGTLPTVEVLQSVANGHAVLTGYRFREGASLSYIIPRIIRQTTLATPKMLISESGTLTSLFYTSLFGGKVNQLERHSLETQLEKLDALMADYDEALQGASENVQSIEQCLNQERGALTKGEHSRMRRSLETYKQSCKQLKKKRKVVQDWIKLLLHIEGEFHATQLNTALLTKALWSLSMLPAEALFNLSEPLPPLKKPSVNLLFAAALSAARIDVLRQNVIEQMVKSIHKLADGRTSGIDIHIRPPQTGAFFMPMDIKRFQDEGFAVNLTIHEYKQNYTRPHLQEMTHALMREADSVLFFNEKDRKNAIRASQKGVLLFGRLIPGGGLYALEPYDLAGKANELTVASQLLSSNPESIEAVLAKPPNILSFGTIRNGKGFEEALGLAREIKRRVQAGDKRFTSTVFVAGDPQGTALMQELFAERYGEQRLKKLQQTFRAPQADASDAERRAYWQLVKDELEEQLQNENLPPENPFLVIYPWCKPKVLERLKHLCKFVCRMDDMGMRYNGSGVISVLDAGIVYTKWGCVTDEQFINGGEYEGAVDLGSNKYGIHQSRKFFDSRRQTLSTYRRDPGSRPVAAILDSIIAREKNQQKYKNQPWLSDNYQSVKKAQALLREVFTLENSTNHLKQAFAARHLTHPGA